MKQLAGRDALFLYLGGTNTSTILTCSVIAKDDGGPFDRGHPELVSWLDRRLGISDMFRSKLVRLPGDIGMPYWMRDPDFTVADHLEVHDGKQYTWAAARELLAGVADGPIDFSKPPWSMHVIPDITGIPGRSGLATIVAVHYHHAAFDGSAFAALSMRMFSHQGDFQPDETVGPGTSSVAALTIRELIRMPALWFRAARGAARAARTARRKRSSAPERPRRREWPVTRFNGEFVGPRTADFLSLDRVDMVDLKSRVPGATVNDLMLSIVGEAVRRYLEIHGEQPGTSMSALAPISTRKMRASGDSNQFAFMTVDLNTTEPDLRTRARLIAAATAAEKMRVEAEATEVADRMVDLVPAPVLRLLARQNSRGRKEVPTSAPFNVVVSNVHSHADSPKIFGIDIVDGFGIQPVSAGATLCHAIVNRADKIVISLTVDRSVMSDTTAYCQLLRDSFDAHVSALAG